MAAIPYDPTLDSLIHPGKADDFFTYGSFANNQIPSGEALCAEISRLAYVREVSRLESYLKRADFVLAEAVGYGQKASASQFFIAERSVSVDQPIVVVVFRGSEPEDYMDLATDANFPMDTWAGKGKVHIGFRDACPDVKVLESKLTPFVKSKARVLFTGHSLGAAIALLAAALYPPDYLYTFGGPRVGDREFAASVPAEHARYQNCHDLVTRLPLEGQFIAYVHVGEPRYINRYGKVEEPTPSMEAMVFDQGQAAAEYVTVLAKYKAQHMLGLKTLVLTRDLADHSAINYLSAVMGLRA